ncbi:hypothetical protein [Aquirufa antheringensis]|uniref:hypothetical protein n=1 Tax=Aquirufa antheringensis TaxID=2516559 RepID=UPI001032A098|nr:hypothetical protein [Aquirufa antheringensis]TBH71437.1 hypothetical protein EWU21_03845 [Aquirufa antheringensis]
MKNYFILAALLCCFYGAQAQTPLKSINYQALIVDPAAIELPGNGVQAQLYLNKDIWVKFGIYAGSTLQFEELHKTKTDAYGLINLEIGAGDNTSAAGTFASLNWGGPVKKLVTQVSFDLGAKYTEVSNRGLNYLPYAHFAEEAGKLSGTLPLTSGGTGATTAVTARANLGLGNVDNTADVDKPVSGLVLAQLNNKESLLNKSTSILLDSTSQVKYPSVKAVKEYVDSRSANSSVANQASSANLATKATALETARTINGVAFDGSSNISIPVDAAVLTGIIPLEKGGTGATNAAVARTNLGLRIGLDVQAPLVAGVDYQSPLRPGIDVQVPLVSGVDYQVPLVAGVNYQTPLIAGSGITLTGNTIQATGLTTANLSATASITNGQLANNQITLGSTSAILGGTYSSMSGFSSLSATTFIGDLSGNASTATAALTANTANSASTATSATFATAANTATTLSSPQTIFGYPFDGSAAITGIISPAFGGTGINNGSKTISLAGDLVTSGNYSTTINIAGVTNITLPTSGTMATLAGTETLTNKTFVNSSLTGTLTLGGTTFPSSPGAMGQVLSLTSSGVASWTSALRDGFDETTATGSTGNLVAVTAGQTNFTLTQTPTATTKLKMYVNGILISQNAYSYKTTSAFTTTATAPTPFLAYVTANNGSYVIALGDRIQFVYSY